MCEHKEVSTFSGIQFQYPRQIIQKGGRHPNIPALFKPRVRVRPTPASAATSSRRRLASGAGFRWATRRRQVTDVPAVPAGRLPDRNAFDSVCASLISLLKVIV